jgi:hypothetical protein
MIVQTYDEKLEAFAKGKRLRRFRGMVRNPKDPTCDACGSVMPNHLWGLRDMDSGRDYFVGQACLSALSGMFVVERPFVRANLAKCFERTRGEEAADEEGEGQLNGGEPGEEGPAVSEDGQARTVANGHAPDIQVHESEELVTVLVRVASACGRHQAWGAASEPRYRQAWRPDSQLVMRPTAVPNEDAVAVCLARAQHMACQELQATSVATPARQPNGTSG